MPVYTVRVLRGWTTTGIILSLLLLVAGGMWLISLVPKESAIGIFLVFFLFTVPWLLGYWLLKKLAVREMSITVGPEAVQISSADATATQYIPLGEIVSYRYEEFNDVRRLVLRLRTGKKVKIGRNDMWGKDDDMLALARYFEDHHATAVAAGEGAHHIRREKGFFEKPFANVLGWGIVALLVMFTGYLLVHGIEPRKTDDVLMMYSSSLLFLGPWLRARRKQEQA